MIIYDRKHTILLNSFLGLVSAGLFPLSKMFQMVSILLVGRFVAGIHCGNFHYTIQSHHMCTTETLITLIISLLLIGMASSLVPLYLMEVAPNSHKGAMGVLQVLGFCLGLLIAQILGQEQLLGKH